MLKIKEAIVVEGRYDKNTLSQLVDTLILETSGFSIFHDAEQMALLRKIAARQGLIVLTDSDGAGFLIRNHLKGCISPDLLRHAYVPDVYGKERRKKKGGSEGKLGVEGMPPDVLRQALLRAGATVLGEGEQPPPETKGRPMTKADLFGLGLSGADGSAARREQLLSALDLPQRMSANAMLAVLNRLSSYEEVARLCAQLEAQEP